MKTILKFIVPVVVLLTLVFLVIKPMIARKEHEEEVPEELVELAAEK